MNSNTVLAVDDEPFNLEIIEEILEEHYDLHCVASGPECLEAVRRINPSVILLDVSMPDMDGYEVCRRLKEDPETSNITVMFVSARGSVEERIEGYNVGAEDYIVKPFGQQELQGKLDTLFKVVENKRMLEQQLQDATDTAFNAMANSSEMGSIVQYVEQIGKIDEKEELAQALINCMRGFGLKTSIEFRTKNNRSQYSSEGICSPMVVELFELLQNKGRLYEFMPRILVNYPRVSLLIMNLPSDDPEKLGRIRDNICFVVGVTEHQLDAILTRKQLGNQKLKLRQAFSMVRDKFEDLVGVLNLSHEMNEAIFRELQEEFEDRIPLMGLDEDQEQYIYKKVDDTIQKSVAREDLLQDITRAFTELENDLSVMLK
ncbi:Response regulator PleD [Pseudoalteromonas sp. P1-9]|uniref:response regulator n=1 Tax=Pseudoalteromonas sp. P1-9 TaxID=1710354 RepID=UPI0006D5E42E|nr:response regulator [Pseudoalteromonas sp. P1-9]KPV96607.1 Response regulator PleD [Pseudoalteromonas sp. P1-9]